jgi:hypothetical protein
MVETLRHELLLAPGIELGSGKQVEGCIVGRWNAAVVAVEHSSGRATD